MKHRKILTALAVAALIQACSGGSEPTQPAASADASVFIVSPANGDTVTSPVTVEFGISGYKKILDT